MNDLSTIKTTLEARLRDLQDRARHIEEDLSEPPDPNWSENAVESEGDEVLEAVGDLALDEIAHIETALAKIEAGSYGICELCDEAIDPKRLAAVPYATTCIKCTP